MKQNYPQKYLWRNRICHKYIDMCALIGNLLLMVMRRYLKNAHRASWDWRLQILCVLCGLL